MNQNNFKNNYHGVLTHDGWTKVAKFNITATVLHTQNRKILVKGKHGKGNYECELHKNLLPDFKFIDKDDTVGIRWNMGKPYVVAYRKAGYDNFTPKPTGDAPLTRWGEIDE